MERIDPPKTFEEQDKSDLRLGLVILIICLTMLGILIYKVNNPPLPPDEYYEAPSDIYNKR